MKVFVQFADENKTEVVGFCANPQPLEVWPFQGEVKTDDPRYLTFISSQELQSSTTDPVEKLKMFLLANPDVAAILN